MLDNHLFSSDWRDSSFMRGQEFMILYLRQLRHSQFTAKWLNCVFQVL